MADDTLRQAREGKNVIYSDDEEPWNIDDFIVMMEEKGPQNCEDGAPDCDGGKSVRGVHLWCTTV